MRSRPVGARRPWLLAALGVAALVLGGYVVSRTILHESSAPATLGSAIERFRAQPPVARELPPALRGRAPTPGVYLYATRGFEQSQALGTRRHDYPPRTTISVGATAHGCLRIRWDALTTRWDAVLTCPRRGGAWSLVTQSENHEFANHLDQRTYVCAPGSTYLPATLTTGTTWTSRCAIGGTTTADRGRVLGGRTLTLDGRRTPTVLVRTSTRVSGATTGAGTTFTWLLPRTRLIVRRTIANANRTDTIIGGVPYEERAALALTTLHPLR